MAVRWERAELQLSRDRGAWDRWSVRDVELRGDWLWSTFLDAPRRIYAPMEHKELPHTFARMGVQAKTLVPFVQDYGRLGWLELVQHELDVERLKSDTWLHEKHREHLHLIRKSGEAALHAEPLDWITAHAQTVGWCLDAAYALRITDKRVRMRQCRELSQRLPRPVGRRSTVRRSILSERTIDSPGVTPDAFVGGMVEDYLWMNLAGVRRRVLYTGPGQFRSVWGGDSLLESIYALVADAVSLGRLAQCHECGAVFLQTDERQGYCPPREGQVKSPCMNRRRVRRYRQKVKGKVSHGKTTRTR